MNKTLASFIAILSLCTMPALVWAAEEARVEIERPDDWMILTFLAALIVGLFIMRRMTTAQKNQRIMQHYLRNPESPLHEVDFFRTMSYLAGHPKNFKSVKKQYESWRNFSEMHPDKMHGHYASSLMAATLAQQGIKEGKLTVEEALALLEQSHEQSRNIAKLKTNQNSFLKMVAAQGHMMLANKASNPEQAQGSFKNARWNLIAALSGDLKVFQMIGILESLAGLCQDMAAKDPDPIVHFKQALDYLQMALALNPNSRTVFPALNALCTKWSAMESNAEEKQRLQKIAQESRIGRYQQEPFAKDVWLLCLAAVMNNEKTCRTKIGEMLDVQEEKLYDTLLLNPYLQRFRDKSWFQQLMAQAKQYRRVPLAD